MNLVGNLEDLGLAEILQIVSLSRKSGVLTLNGRSGEGRIVFRQGEVVLAFSPEFCHPLEEILVDKGVMERSAMADALAARERHASTESLATFLMRCFPDRAEAIEGVVREEIVEIVCAFFHWNFGTFDFDLKDGVDLDDLIESESQCLMLQQGVNSQFLALEGARRQDEKNKGGKEMESALALEDELPPQPVVSQLPEREEPTPPAPLELDDEFVAEQPEEVRRPTILLVEDHPLLREALAGSLEDCGYEVFTFSGGADSPLMRLASILREEQRPTLLVDMSLPRMDGSGRTGGTELLELVRGNFPGVPALAMVEMGDSASSMDAARVGVGLVVKPADLEDAAPAVLNDFLTELLPVLNRLRRTQEPSGPVDSVNLGDELLREMGEEPATHPAPVTQSTGLSLLRKMLEELNDPFLGGDVTLLVLRFASEFMNRAVIFQVRRDEIVGLGQFGIETAKGSPDAIVRSISIPRGEDSVFTRIIDGRTYLKEQPDSGKWLRYLLDMLGGQSPLEFFVGPIVSEGKVVALLYGDNLPEERGIGDTDSLEIFLSQAGVAMEKLLLRRKLEGKAVEGK